MIYRPASTAALAACALLWGACPGNTECVAADECASNETCRAGECQAIDEEENDAGPLPLTDGGIDVDGTDAGPQTDAGTAGGDDAGTIGLCDNGDDSLSSDELPLALGAPLRFVESKDDDDGVPVDLDGADNGGVWTWDFTTPHASDAPIELAGLPLDGFWFENEFTVPTGSTAYAIALNGAQQDYAILARTDDELLMLGVASAATDETVLVYAPPVATVKFPLEAGQAWSVDTDVSGTFQGIAYSSTDHYDISTLRTGEAITPAGRFRAWQLQLVLEVTVPIFVFPFSLTYRYVRQSFMTPCYGQVAFAASFQDEQADAFTDALELRRLGLGQ